MLCEYQPIEMYLLVGLIRKFSKKIDRNNFGEEDFNPSTNEVAECVFRLINDNNHHNKSVETLEKQVTSYFNDPSARLNDCLFFSFSKYVNTKNNLNVSDNYLLILK